MSDLSLGRRSILCVGGDSESQAALGELLAGHHVVFAPRAFEAIRELNASTFHGYVLEYWLPDWSGPALCRHIRKIDPHAPIVFCSAAGRDADKLRALRAGANAYLPKPIDPLAFRSKMGAFLSAAELESLNAKAVAAKAAQAELERRLAHASAQVDPADTLLVSSIERTARSKAYKAFIEARGTKAHFDSWWSHVFQSARANHNAR